MLVSMSGGIKVLVCMCFVRGVGAYSRYQSTSGDEAERWWWWWEGGPVVAALPVPVTTRELPVCCSLIYTRLMSKESAVETVA